MLGTQATPKFWTFFCQRWLELDQSLSWSWWHALSKSPWSACEELRTTVLNYDGHAYPGQRPEAERAEMEGAVAPGQLLRVIEDLIRQRLLLRRDGAVIEEKILRKLDRHGEWM
jgi:hypothetical protein